MQLSEHITSRERSLDFTALGMILPNPDPILKAQGKDIATYRAMCHDAVIGGNIRRRKSAIKGLDWGLDRGQAPSRITRNIQALLDDLPLQEIIGQMLDATLYGYQPMEIVWTSTGAMLMPEQILAKPPEQFCFDPQNRLRWKSRQAPLTGELLPDRKFLLPRQDPTYQNPYGFPDLSMCYWPLIFKKGGLKFWLAFTEKFGSAFSVGKLPRNASEQERSQLLDNLEALIQDGVATIPDDGSVELIEMAGKSASAELYERLVLHCRSEINIALLGQNQTTEASANKASATSGLEVTRDLRDGDAQIVADAINQLIRWVCAINWGTVNAPRFSLWDQESQDKLQAQRDKSNYDAGARFTNAYFMRAYGYQEGDLVEAGTGAPPASSSISAFRQALQQAQAGEPASFAEAPANPLQRETDALVAASAPAWSAITDQLQALIEQTDSLEQVQQALVQSWGHLDSAELTKLMAAAYALAELKGLDAARTETGG